MANMGRQMRVVLGGGTNPGNLTTVPMPIVSASTTQIRIKFPRILPAPGYIADFNIWKSITVVLVDQNTDSSNWQVSPLNCAYPNTTACAASKPASLSAVLPFTLWTVPLHPQSQWEAIQFDRTSTPVFNATTQAVVPAVTSLGAVNATTVNLSYSIYYGWSIAVNATPVRAWARCQHGPCAEEALCNLDLSAFATQASRVG